MGAFDLRGSLERAQARLEDRSPKARRPRSDRGRSRLDPAVVSWIEQRFQGRERPPMRWVRRELDAFCLQRGVRPPARTTLYQLMKTLPSRSRVAADLPPAVRETLYNLSQDSSVPGHQLAFHCLNYGGLSAVSYAAGLPWLALYQASLMRGWRPKSRGLLDAILEVRGIR